MGILIVIILRLILPLTILRWPFLGGILALILDYVDFEIVRFFNPAGLDSYQSLDKTLDIYYLSLEFISLSGWKNNLAKNIGRGLFIYRLIGVIIFEVTEIRKVLFFFPNFFEMFFLVYLGYKFFFKKEPNFANTWLKLILFITLSYKLYQEFSLHMVSFDPWLGSGLLGLH